MKSPPVLDFYPPRLQPTLARLFQWVAPLVAYGRFQLDLQTTPESVEHLRRLQGDRVILLPNHPTLQDPIAIFLLSTQAGQLFTYLTAHEQLRGKLGPWLQRLGAYSIRRGLADRASITQTLEILAQPACKLVIFAEGGCSFQNDTVMPFRPGAIQLAFQALGRLGKQGEEIPDLYAVPISIKYRYTQSMTRVIHDTLSGLETALNLPARSFHPPEFYPRLRAVAEQVLMRCEQHYGFHGPELESLAWNDRISRLKLLVLEQCEQQLGIAPLVSLPVRERVYKIQSVLAAQEDGVGGVTGDDRWGSEKISKATMALLNFDAIYDGYVADNPTTERFMDTLTRLEREVFGINEPVAKGHRRAIVQAAEPVNLKPFFPAYQQDKVATVEQLSQQLRQAVQAGILRSGLGNQSSPDILPG